MRRVTGDPRHDQRGQVIVIVVGGFVGLLFVVALLIDGGLAWSSRRQAQAAADTAALASGAGSFERVDRRRVRARRDR